MSQEVTVRIASRWHDYLQGLVSDRRFMSVDDAVEDALRLLEASEDKGEELAKMLREGEDSGDAGSWDLTAFLREARERDASP